MSISLTRMMIVELHFLTVSFIKEEGFHCNLKSGEGDSFSYLEPVAQQGGLVAKDSAGYSTIKDSGNHK